MFERYTETARRVIFFARYEASQFGSPYIETEHLLLGILRDDKALADRFLGSHLSADEAREQIELHNPRGERVSTSVDLPLSNESKHVLAYAAEEAEHLADQHIGTEHLLLGLLREKSSFAATLLTEFGVTIDPIREELRKNPHPVPARPRTSTDGSVHAASVQPQLSTLLRVARELTKLQAEIHKDLRMHPGLPARMTHLHRSIRLWTAVIIAGLVLSGVSAFPLVHELNLLVRLAAHLNLAQHTPALNA